MEKQNIFLFPAVVKEGKRDFFRSYVFFSSGALQPEIPPSINELGLPRLDVHGHKIYALEIKELAKEFYELFSQKKEENKVLIMWKTKINFSQIDMSQYPTYPHTFHFLRNFKKKERKKFMYEFYKLIGKEGK